jgi:cob(I)alamin adenosyltransferase
MGHRLNRFATGMGDNGTIGLANGLRVEKDSPRVLAMGAVDELNSCIGVVLAFETPVEVRECLMGVRRLLFEVGAQLNSPGQQRIADEAILGIERAIEHFNANLEPVEEFGLSGGSLAGATCRLAGAVCHRVESHVVALTTVDPGENDILIPLFNRLSDLLFVLTRSLN